MESEWDFWGMVEMSWTFWEFDGKYMETEWNLWKYSNEHPEKDFICQWISMVFH